MQLHHHTRQGLRAQPVVLAGVTSADLAISQSALPAVPVVGQNVTVTVTASNTGPNAASGVVVNDPLPTGLTYFSDDGSGAYNAINGDWMIGALGSGGSATLHIIATVATTDQLVALAQIGGISPLDTNPANNRASITLTPARQADLGVSVQSSPAPTLVGGTATYTMTLTNLGPDPAYNLVLSQAFPSDAATISSASASDGIFNTATGIWNIASLGKGNAATLILTVTPMQSGSLTNTGMVTLAGDLNNANNSASASVSVTARTTTAALTFAPTILGIGQRSVAMITLSDSEATGTGLRPTGTVTLGDSATGTTYTPAPSCVLAPVVGSTNQSSCQINVIPGVLGVHTITASYSGSAAHAASSSSATITVDTSTPTYRISLPLVVRDSSPTLAVR
jgi:uncharacterized repeat protein (TIGR01451 family)